MPAAGYFGGYPGDTFAFPRSYAWQLSIIGDIDSIAVDGNEITLWINPAIGYYILYTLDPRFWNWSSNRWTLDYIVTDCRWFAFFDGVPHLQFFTVNFWYRGLTLIPTVSLIQPFAATLEEFIPLPQSPPDYWKPPPLE